MLHEQYALFIFSKFNSSKPKRANQPKCWGAKLPVPGKAGIAGLPVAKMICEDMTRLLIKAGFFD